MQRLTLPPKTTEALGEEVAAELAQWVAETVVLRDQSVSRDEYREILSRMDILEYDVSGLKDEVAELRHEMNARFDRMQSEVNARFDRMQSEVNARFDRMQSEMNVRLDGVNARFDAMEERFDARFDRLQSDMNARIDTMHEVVRSQTRWLIATLIALGGLISALITIFEFIR